jgi:chromosome segregation ATPase
MKVKQVFITLFLATIAGSVVAQEEAEVGADGTMRTPPVNCDDVCAMKVAEVVGNADREKENIHWHLNAAKEELEQAKHAGNTAAADVEHVKSQLASTEQAVANAKRDAEAAWANADAAKADAEAVKKDGAARAATLERKIKSLEADVAVANAKAAEFSDARFIINVAALKADVMALIKKTGLIKD